MTAKCEAYQFTFIVYGEAEEEGGIETGFVVCVVQLKHMISTCDRIVSHCWCVWMEEGGGVEGSQPVDGITGRKVYMHINIQTTYYTTICMYYANVIA